MRKVLILPLSGLGYVFPSIRLGHLLERHGHRILFVVSQEFSLLIESQGFETVGIRNDGRPFLDPDGWHDPGRAVPETKVLLEVAERFGPQVILSSPLVLASYVLAERFGIPMVNVGFAEYLYPSVFGETDPVKQWRLKSMTDRYNAYRAALGLARVESSPESSPLIGDLHLLRSVPELADQPYLPRQVRHVGPLLWDMPSSHARLDAFIALHRAAGRPVVYVQIGRLFEDFPAWESVLTALGRVQVGAILDIGRSDFMGSPPRVPGNCFLTRYVPLGDIADRVSLVVCSAQTTSVLASIIHGKPLLVIPHSTDSHELASRVGSKGLARMIVDRASLTASDLEVHFEALSSGAGCPATPRFQSLFREYDDERVYRVLSSVLA